MKLTAEIYKKVKFDRTFYLANMIDLTNDSTVLSNARKPIVRFLTPDVYTTVITGFEFGFVGGDYQNTDIALFTNLNLRFDLVIDQQESLFNRGANLSIGSTIGDLPEFSDRDTFIEVRANKDVMLLIKDIGFPFGIDNPEIKVYGMIKGYFMTLRGKHNAEGGDDV